ncbi:MAG: Rid family detoxifying hydrolase [Legionellaceae bacterium]|nr:Rid family detoxifying hydrolase [Legionellaceae bacterium]MBP9774989.1 Rid family detoxifying hydrolase [Legionellaceae bacterium]
MQAISSSEVPAVIGTYSAAIKAGDTIYLSGQIPLDPLTQVLCSEDITAQIKQVIKNMEALCLAAGGNLADVVKITVYLMDLAHSTLVNETMAAHFAPPYPARAMVQVAGLPRGAKVEMDAIMVLR